MSYVDLHLHLLPGVDDGAPDEAASLEHAARLVDDGVEEASVTPHVGHAAFPLDVATIAERTRELQAAIDAHRIGLRLHPGGEIHPTVAGSLTHADLDALALGPVGARWVLLEAPFAGIDDAFLDGCRHIRHRGFGVVIAHPERAANLMTGGLRALRPELAAGAVLQVNACSLMGRHGRGPQGAARRLVRTGLAWLIASDGHPPHRGHTLRDGWAAARDAGVSATQAWRLTQANPRFLLRHGLPDIGAALVARAWRSQSLARVEAARRAGAATQRF